MEKSPSTIIFTFEMFMKGVKADISSGRREEIPVLVADG